MKLLLRVKGELSKSILWSTSRYTVWIWVTLATLTAV